MMRKQPTLPLDDNGPETLHPLLKWAGGKRWQVPHLSPLWQPHTHRRLVEPFCGGAAVSLALAPVRALLNDVIDPLINFYRWVAHDFRISIQLENDEALYYVHRARFNHLLRSRQGNSAEAAGIFYYLNRTGYNGLCRFNASGEFNVPFGRYKSITYLRDFPAHASTLARWDVQCGDFAGVPLEPDDFVYADPPYDVEFTGYAPGGFSWSDQVRTAEWLTQHPGPVVLVNQATPRIVALYRRHGFNVAFLDGPRRIACTGDRTPAREVMATRNL